MNDLNLIKYWVIDVDGTMTDGGIYYDEHGNELKKFNARDSAAYFALHACGAKIIVLTGRECRATERRMKELKFDYIFQNVKNKKEFLVEFMKQNNISKNEVGYIGDDLNDLPAMKLVGFVGCPKDSCREIIDIADYVSCKDGGKGAVRDIIEFVLRKSNKWNDAVSQVYGIGV